MHVVLQVPLGLGRFEKEAGSDDDACVVVEDVDAPELAVDRRDTLGDARGVRHVERTGECPHAHAAQFIGTTLEVGEPDTHLVNGRDGEVRPLPDDVGHDDVRSVSGERPGGGEPDAVAATRAGHHGHPAPKHRAHRVVSGCGAPPPRGSVRRRDMTWLPPAASRRTSPACGAARGCEGSNPRVKTAVREDRE